LAAGTPAPRDRIQVRGLRVTATHGVLAEERQHPQPFEVDLDLEVDLAPAGRSDSLEDTVDYGALCLAAEKALAGPPANLLEHLAERVASVVLDAAGPAATAVIVTVRKMRPPVPVEMGSAGVTIVRSRPPAAS
jgi:7,8-dihydroneopterin aldolase/epimerase/oxygenase